jgi:hypothetical protein
MASIYDNWMRNLNKEDDDMAGPQVQAALLSYLNGTATVDEAACEFRKYATGSESRSAELAWSLLIDAAEEFPEAHEKLLELLDVMVRSQPTEVAEFAFELREAYDGASRSLLLSTDKS